MCGAAALLHLPPWSAPQDSACFVTHLGTDNDQVGR